MMSSRETVYSAVFSVLLEAVTALNFKTVSRRVKLWSEVPVDQQPALFQQQVSEESTSAKAPAPPNKNFLRVDIIIYANAGPDSSESVDPQLNAAIDAIERVFPSDPRQKSLELRLPGIIDCRIHGIIEFGEGNLNGQGIVIIPLRIVAI